MMFEITSQPIDPRAVERAVIGKGSGAVVTFLGMVRDHTGDGTPVTGLSYEAHEHMAIDEFRRIAQEARVAHGDLAIAIVHRVGELEVGEIAVVVSAAAAHRAAAFAAASYAIDQLKARAPIWKKERYAGGAAAWITS